MLIKCRDEVIIESVRPHLHISAELAEYWGIIDLLNSGALTKKMLNVPGEYVLKGAKAKLLDPLTAEPIMDIPLLGPPRKAPQLELAESDRRLHLKHLTIPFNYSGDHTNAPLLPIEFGGLMAQVPAIIPIPHVHTDEDDYCVDGDLTVRRLNLLHEIKNLKFKPTKGLRNLKIVHLMWDEFNALAVDSKIQEFKLERNSPISVGALR